MANESGSVPDRLNVLKERVSEAAKRSGRSPEDVHVVLVTKTVSLERIKEAFDAGCVTFGENRVQELLKKKELLPEHVRWHFIGHLQTNKVKQIVDCVDLIQSLDRPELLAEIEKQAKKKNVEQVHCLIQVNIAGQDSQFGLMPEDVEPFASTISKNSPVKVKGLMAIGPNTTEPITLQKSFRLLRGMQIKLKESLPFHDWDLLSMGMSNDFELAILEGSNMIRVGSVVFGERVYG